MDLVLRKKCIVEVGVSASKWCQLAKVRAGAPGHPSIPMNLTDA